MARIDEFEMAVLIEDPEEHRGVTAHFRVIAKKAIHVIEEKRGVGAEGHARERTLEHGGNDGGAKPLAGNVGNHKRSTVITQREDIKVVAPNGQAGEIDAGHGEVRVVGEIARQERLLNVERDVDLLLQALALAFPFDEASVVENAGGVCRKSVENLAIEFGKSRGAPRIQIKNAEEITAPDIDHRFLGVCAGHRPERNHHDGAKPLRHDALRGLQIHVGLREILGDDRRLLLDR